MAPFVLLSLALAVMAAGAALVAALQLLRVVRRLQAAATATAERLRPLVDELGDEVTVTSAEAAALQERVDRFSRDARRRSRGLPPVASPHAPVGG